MASTKYIGYLGGAAVAAGVGAAIAVAGAATANADAEADAPKTEAPKAESGAERAKPLEKLTDRIEKVASTVTKAATASKPKPSTDVDSSDSKLSDAGVSATQITVRKPTAKEFEAQQVERLKGLFQPREAVAPSAAESDSDVVTQADEEGIPNPFRANDPDPVDVPDAVVAVRDQLVGAAPEALAPYVREGVEQAYRGSQMIPWVNAVVPITKIIPLIGPATGEGPAALDARQVHRQRTHQDHAAGFVPVLRLRPGRRSRQPGGSGRRAEGAGVRRCLGSARFRQFRAQRRPRRHRQRAVAGGLVSRHDHHRHVKHAQHLGRRRAEEQPLRRTEPARSDHDQIAVAPVELADRILDRRPVDDGRSDWNRLG